MSHDLLMLRGETEGAFNLMVGEPLFLQSYLGNIQQHFKRPPDTRYPPFQGVPELQDAIKSYLSGQYQYVVVTVGAKQALCAAMYALKEVEEYTSAWHRMPFWPSFSTLTKSVGLDFRGLIGLHPDSLVINTVINNPDGNLNLGGADIIDCAYVSQIYGFYEAALPPHKISVWSPAKLMGLSGVRIGWAATNDEELAFKMSEFVEKSTSGVSTLDQYALLGVLEARLNYLGARELLLSNGELFRTKIMSLFESVYGVCGNKLGMFNWVKPWKPQAFTDAINKANVKLLPGIACGREGWYRINMGHLYDYTDKAFTAIRDNYAP